MGIGSAVLLLVGTQSSPETSSWCALGSTSWVLYTRQINKLPFLSRSNLFLSGLFSTKLALKFESCDLCSLNDMFLSSLYMYLPFVCLLARDHAASTSNLQCLRHLSTVSCMSWTFVVHLQTFKKRLVQC